MERRVVVTGLGLVTPLGLDVESTWKGLLSGKSGIVAVSMFDASSMPVRIAGEVKGFHLDSSLHEKVPATYMNRALQFAVSAAQMAIDDARIDLSKLDPSRTGVSLGANMELADLNSVAQLSPRWCRDGGSETLNFKRLASRADNSYFFRRSIHIASCTLSILFGAMGPNMCIQSACSSSAVAIGESLRIIQRGDADVMITGGCDTMLHPTAIGAFTLLGVLSKRCNEPWRASRPFDLKRDGMVLSEGAGVVLLEELNCAVNRGAQIYAELVGYGTSMDAYRITDIRPDGLGAFLAMQHAIKDAGMEPQEIDYINAHGTATLLNDKIETIAIKKLFGRRAYDIPISSTKSMIGHTISATGAIEFISTIKTVVHDAIPPTINLEYRDPRCDLDYVPNTMRSVPVKAAISNSFAFGGQNACLVVRKPR